MQNRIIRMVAVALLGLMVAAIVLSAQGPSPSFTMDRVYQEIIAPLEKDNYNLHIQIMTLTDYTAQLERQVAELNKRLAELTKPQQAPH